MRWDRAGYMPSQLILYICVFALRPSSFMFPMIEAPLI